MHLYLSSYKLGNEGRRLLGFFSGDRRVAYVSNALDFSYCNLVRRRQTEESDMQALRDLGLSPFSLDLRAYFGRQGDLRKLLTEVRALFVSGGNVFVLRQAFKISGLDELILKDLSRSEDFIYSGYSAAGCVLGPTLKAYAIVDVPGDLPYPEQRETIWEGLGLVDYAFMPHFDSPHPESADISKEIEVCERLGIKYRALRDGEVIVESIVS